MKVFESKFAAKVQLANSLVDSREVLCEFVEYIEALLYKH